MGFRALAPSHLSSHSRLHAFMLRNIGFVQSIAFSSVFFSFLCVHHSGWVCRSVFSGVSKSLLHEGRINVCTAMSTARRLHQTDGSAVWFITSRTCDHHARIVWHCAVDNHPCDCWERKVI